MATAILLPLLALDLAVRWAFPIPQRGYAVWTLPPHSVVRWVSAPDGIDTEHRYNRFGLRGPDLPVGSELGPYIACIGDSYTEGMGAAEHDSWPGRLQEHLSSLGCQVANLGSSGAGLAQYSRLLCEVAGPLRPTDVVTCLLPSDFYVPQLPSEAESWHHRLNTQFGHPFRDARDWFGKPAARLLPGWTYLVDRTRGRWPLRTGMYWPRWSEEHLERTAYLLHRTQGIELSMARAIVEQRIHDIDPYAFWASRRARYSDTMIAAALIDPLSTHRVTVAHMGTSTAALEAVADRWVGWYQTRCTAVGIRPWVLYFPEACLVSPGPWGPLKARLAANAPDLRGDTSVRDILAEVCQRRRVLFMDATPVLSQHSSDKLYHRYDTHPTARAYELVAGTVAVELRRVLVGPNTRRSPDRMASPTFAPLANAGSVRYHGVGRGMML